MRSTLRMLTLLNMLGVLVQYVCVCVKCLLKQRREAYRSLSLTATATYDLANDVRLYIIAICRRIYKLCDYRKNQQPDSEKNKFISAILWFLSELFPSLLPSFGPSLNCHQ